MVLLSSSLPQNQRKRDNQGLSKTEGEEAATWAAEYAEQKKQYPSRTLCYSVSLALQALQAVKMEKQENHDRDNTVTSAMAT